MPWDRSNGTNPKYRSREHIERRAALVKQLKRDGHLTCTATQCVLPTRTIINPNGREPDGLHLGHDDSGETYAGPQHNLCNVKDGARRARAKQTDDAPTMRLTPGLTRPGG